MASAYHVGTGIAEVTDPAIGLQMQGFADTDQKTAGCESPLFSRAFIVEDPQTRRRVAMVCADIWTGTSVVKEEVLAKLKAEFGDVYTCDNVLITGNHTHSAPGGYTGYMLYDSSETFDHEGKGFDPCTFDCIVSGIVASVRMAHRNLGPGKVHVATGTIEKCGSNRSMPAYLNNPKSELQRYAGADTDNQMLLLKFTKPGILGGEYPVGVLSWYPIHPTDRGQLNRMVCGDCKGYASTLFESAMRTDPFAPETFVAAFANSNAGDVSGNLDYKKLPDGVNDIKHMYDHAEKQYKAARKLFDECTEELSGVVDYRHTRKDMSAVTIDPAAGARTWPAALGLSFAAGSREDGTPKPESHLREGITVANLRAGEALTGGLLVDLGLFLKGIPMGLEFGDAFQRGHSPKPIALAVGAREGLVPKVLPLQLLRIGQLVVTGVPAELTTMAGRRLRDTVLNELGGAGVRHLALACYSNDYSQYITTKEEYEMQHYEGASTLYGPHTLIAYQREFLELAKALKAGTQLGPSLPAPRRYSQPVKRWRFRNLSNTTFELKFYDTFDTVKLATLPNGTKTLPAHQEVAFPENEFWSTTAKVAFSGVAEINASAGNLVTVTETGAVTVTSYVPPARTKPQAMFVAAGAPAAKGDPCIVPFASQFLHVVYRDANDQVADLAWNGSGWGYSSLNRLAAGAPAAKGDPCIVPFASQFLHVVYRDANDQVADLAWNGSGWGYSSLNRLAAGAPAAKGDPCIVPFASQFLHVVYRDANDQVADLVWSGSAWLYFNLSRLAAGAPAAKGDPCIVPFASQFLHVVYRDANDQVADLAWNGSGWGYSSLNRLAAGAPAAKGDPCIVQVGAASLHVVYRDANDEIADIVWSGSAWLYFNLSEVANVAPTAKGDPCIAQFGPGFLQVAYRDDRDEITSLIWDGSIWRYSNLRLATGAPAAKGDPCVVQFLPGLLHVVYRDANDQVADLAWNGANWKCVVFGAVR